MTVSIVVPTFNEEENIQKLISYLKTHATSCLLEIIVCDGGSKDNTRHAALAAGAIVIDSEKGRATQLNKGAFIAKGEILYFLHADSYPPATFCADLTTAVKSGIHSGCYRLCFDYSHWFLKLNSWFTRFNVNAIRFGDQSLFVTRDVFLRSGGFNETLIVMEDQEIIKRIRRLSRFKILENRIITSARKYLEVGIYKLQGVFFIIYLLYRLGFSQHYLVKVYRNFIRSSKI